MKGTLHVSGVRMVAASTADVARGLLGWLTITIGEALVLDGVAFRRALDGRYVLSFPARRSRSGQLHHHVRPLDDAARRDLEAQILRALGLTQEAQP